MQFGVPHGARRRSNRACLRHAAVNPPATLPLPSGASAVPRRLGVFELLALAGKSRQSMAWWVRDSRRSTARRPLMLLLPREQPGDAAALQRWDEAVRRAARLEHPNLARACEIGSCENWPYLLYDPAGARTLGEQMRGPASTPQEAATLCMQALRGLAFAHDGGVAHGELQPFMLLIGEHQALRIIGLELVAATGHAPGAVQTSLDALRLGQQREAAQRDVLSVGLLLHWLLAGRAPLDQDDIAAQIESLPPRGRDIVRLPWQTTLPLPEALRAIADRATHRQPRQRYRSARGMERALDGWLRSQAAAGGGPLELLRDRLHAAGTLPGAPASHGRAARLAAMDQRRTGELAEVVLEDLGLSFELLRGANHSLQRAARSAGEGEVLTVRRAIALLGMEGVRRAALALRPWPGPLGASAAVSLGALIDDTQRAARLAQALRPPGYDAEAVRLVALLQGLGRLVSAYHFPDEWQQVRRLSRPDLARQAGEPDAAGMTEQAAGYAVLGIDIEDMGIAVARQWGLGDAALHMVRRLPLATLPCSIGNDGDMLRAVASCAHEAHDALGLPAALQDGALRRVTQRYGRALGFRVDDLQAALRECVQHTGPAPTPDGGGAHTAHDAR